MFGALSFDLVWVGQSAIVTPSQQVLAPKFCEIYTDNRQENEDSVTLLPGILCVNRISTIYQIRFLWQLGWKLSDICDTLKST